MPIERSRPRDSISLAWLVVSDKCFSLDSTCAVKRIYQDFRDQALQQTRRTQCIICSAECPQLAHHNQRFSYLV
jgi:hypothetical protein